MSISDDLYRPARRPPSIIATIVDKIILLCGIVPYALIALGLRFVVARVFFLAGQTKITGPAASLPLPGLGDFTVTLPAAIKDSTFELFQTQYAGLPMPPTVAAALFTYAEFILPICLILGFATRLSALALLAMTILVQVYVAPQLLWTTHAYLFGILMVLMTLGPGALSVDGLIRHVYRT